MMHKGVGYRVHNGCMPDQTMDTDEIQRGLEQIGLSSYQSQAYTTLLDHGALPAIDVAKRSSIPASRIYDVLADLEQKGYIETFERKDKRHARAREPSEVVDGLRHVSEHLSDTAQEIENIWEYSTLQDHRLVLFEQVDSVLDQAEKLVRSADASVDVAATPAQYYRLQEAMAHARDSDVVVRVSLEGVTETRIETEQSVTEIRRRQIPGPFVAVVDRTHTCFAPNERAPVSYGIVLDDRILSFVFHWYFQTCLWAVCEPIYRRSGDDLTYVSTEEFVRDVFPFWRSGAILPVTVDGRDIETGERRTETGIMTDISYPSMDLSSADPPTYGELASDLTLVVENESGRHLVGGWGAVWEDIEAEQVTLYSSESVFTPPIFGQP